MSSAPGILMEVDVLHFIFENNNHHY